MTDRQGSLASRQISELSIKETFPVLDSHDVYVAALKVAILSHRMEPRFRQRVMKPPSELTQSVKLPPDTIDKLKERLKSIAIKIDKIPIDDLTRRSFLRFYADLLDPAKAYERISKPEELVVRFVSCATKEVSKLVSENEVSAILHTQTSTFINLLIQIANKDTVLVSSLEQLKGGYSKQTDTFTTVKPSFKLEEMALADMVGKVFSVDRSKVQKNVLALEDSATEKNLKGDFLRILDELKAQKDTFPEFVSWRNSEQKAVWVLVEKMTSSPSQGGGFIPSEKYTYFYNLLLRCLGMPETQPLVNECCRLWRIDNYARSCLILHAAHASILKTEEVDTEQTERVINVCKRLFAEWDPTRWPVRWKDSWTQGLTTSYIQTMYGIRDGLTMVFNTTKPKFGGFLKILSLLESDPCFPDIDSSLSIKWQKKLKRALLRTSEARYITLLSSVPRDNSLEAGHVIVVAEKIVVDIRLLQKRYPSPLLGFLNVAVTCARLITAMFGEDSKNMMSHINTTTPGEAIEAYRSLREVRSIYTQVERVKRFKFDLEVFFLPYIEKWCMETNISALVLQSVKADSMDPVDLQNGVMSSTCVVDAFSAINQIFKVVKDLNWEDMYSLAQIWTLLLKSVSHSVDVFSSAMMDRVIADLSEADPESETWFSTLSMIGNKPLPQPYNFVPATCIAVNNLEAMLRNAAMLEEMVDPDILSKVLSLNSPTSHTHVFTIRILRAENLRTVNGRLCNPYCTLADGKTRARIARTRTLEKDDNPTLDEEFEMSCNDATLSATVWDGRGMSHDICGRGLLALSPSQFIDGVPRMVSVDLDIQGKVFFEVIMESERDDPLFCIGKVNRTLTRTRDRAVKLIVTKFSTFIHFSFSRPNLKTCGNGAKQLTKQEACEAMVPLFDYLNSTLSVLASSLTPTLLIKVMLQAWEVVLAAASTLLLPKLSSAKFASANATRSSWQDTVSSAITGHGSVPGFGKPLTRSEVDCVFLWLDSLCEFFHNQGEGPPLQELENFTFQQLQQIPKYYDWEVSKLKEEVNNLTPDSLKSINGRDYGTGPVRKKTIVSQGSKANRRRATEAEEEIKRDPAVARAAFENVVLRILLTRNESSYVAERLDQKEHFASSISAEAFSKWVLKDKKGS